MLRNILMLCPALAFALPFVAANPTMARPLSGAAQPAQWGDDHDDNDQIELTVCTQTQIFVQTGDDRAYSCELQSGPQCLANCTAEAAAPACAHQLGLGARSADLAACEEQRAALCRSTCEAGGATFCTPDLKARGGWWDDDDDGFEHIDQDDRDDDDDNGGQEEIVFVETETCLDLDLDN